MEIDRQKNKRGKRKPKVLTGLAIDSKGRLMKRLKVNVDNFPREEDAPKVKVMLNKKGKKSKQKQKLSSKELSLRTFES